MSRYFTSDWHLGSTNINSYAKRSFVSAGDAASKLVDNCNDVAKWKTDVVFHVGDFWLRGYDRHDSKEDENTLTAGMKDYLNFIHASFILLEGNHDKSNIESDMKSMSVNLNQNYVNVSVAHYPSTHDFYKYVGNSNRNSLSRNFIRQHQNIENLHIHLCGHVHDSWLLNYDKIHNVLNVNVGVDVWNYKPVKDVEITELLDFFFVNGANILKMEDPHLIWNRDRWNKWVLRVKGELAVARAQRKAEKHAAKGLTPEECERRKLEAMKKKGLLN